MGARFIHSVILRLRPTRKTECATTVHPRPVCCGPQPAGRQPARGCGAVDYRVSLSDRGRPSRRHLSRMERECSGHRRLRVRGAVLRGRFRDGRHQRLVLQRQVATSLEAVIPLKGDLKAGVHRRRHRHAQGRGGPGISWSAHEPSSVLAPPYRKGLRSITVGNSTAMVVGSPLASSMTDA